MAKEPTNQEILDEMRAGFAQTNSSLAQLENLVGELRGAIQVALNRTEDLQSRQAAE